MPAQIDAHFVLTWKTSKVLYEKYGGPVIFQQANPLEPVGAYRKLLEENEKMGRFTIHDPEVREQFWRYFVTSHRAYSKDQIDFSVPWWEQKESSPNKK